MDFKGLMSKAGKAFGEEVDKKAKEMIKATKKDLMRRTDSEIKNLKQILYLIFNYPHKHYTFKHFEV